MRNGCDDSASSGLYTLQSIWHHMHDLPEERRLGVDFGIALSIWIGSFAPLIGRAC